MTGHSSDQLLYLPQVTLIAVTSVNVMATIQALQASLSKVKFGACKLLTDANPKGNLDGIELVPIARLGSANAYSKAILTQLADHVTTSHCLIVQWDGHVIDAGRWRPDFLEYDYIGASWPQFTDGHNVGNGGFSLRSRRLLEICRSPGFDSSHAEDLAIGRVNRDWLEQRGFRFAPSALADIFSAERASDPRATFGYHGVWHMPHLLGIENFWKLYRKLDDRNTIQHDFGTLLRQLFVGRGGVGRIFRLLLDRANNALRLKGSQ